jgi:hypothetical protein
MGLDMYAYKTSEQVEEHGFETPLNSILIQQWRKHPNLHGWMEQLYRLKGGAKEFNVETVRLDLDDINALERAVKQNQLPETTGFFFGESQPEDKKLDLRFIKAARKAINEGYSVYYTSWW